MNTTQTLLAHMNRSAADSLARAAQELGDRITWKPLGKGRSALEQLQECAGMALLGAQIFETHAVPTQEPDALEKLHAEHPTPEKALALLDSATEKLTSALEAFPTEKLSDSVVLPFGPDGLKKTFLEVALLIHWNSTHHEGQINYIKTLAAE